MVPAVLWPALLAPGAAVGRWGRRPRRAPAPAPARARSAARLLRVRRPELGRPRASGTQGPRVGGAEDAGARRPRSGLRGPALLPAPGPEDASRLPGDTPPVPAPRPLRTGPRGPAANSATFLETRPPPPPCSLRTRSQPPPGPRGPSPTLPRFQGPTPTPTAPSSHTHWLLPAPRGPASEDPPPIPALCLESPPHEPQGPAPSPPRTPEN